MAISIPDLERRAALGWRAADEAQLGDWLLCAAGGFTGRANSALATGGPARPLPRGARLGSAVRRRPGHDRSGGADDPGHGARASERGPGGAGGSAARTLYQRIGFTAHHGYHYRLAPAGQRTGPFRPLVLGRSG